MFVCARRCVCVCLNCNEAKNLLFQMDPMTLAEACQLDIPLLRALAALRKCGESGVKNSEQFPLQSLECLELEIALQQVCI